MSVSMVETESKNFENPAYETGQQQQPHQPAATTLVPAPTGTIKVNESLHSA